MTPRGRMQTSDERMQRTKKALLLVGLVPVLAYIGFTAFMFVSAGPVNKTADDSLSIRLPLGWWVEKRGEHALWAKEQRFSVTSYWDDRELPMRIEVAVIPTDDDAYSMAPTALIRSEVMHTAVTTEDDVGITIDVTEMTEVESGSLTANGIEGKYLIYERPEGDLSRSVMFWEGIEDGHRVMVRYSSEAGHLKRGFLLRRLHTVELLDRDAPALDPRANQDE